MDARSELTSEEFDRFRALLYRTAGISIPPSKRVLVTNRVRRRLQATGIARFADYYAHLLTPQGAAELPKFVEALTTNETYFYRDAHQYQWFGDEFLPAVARLGLVRKRPKTLSVWSAACSTGEELYSAALQLDRRKADFLGWAVQLLGTDINGEVVEAARAGRYEARSLRLVPLDERAKYFEPIAGTTLYELRPEIRQRATWRAHNLMRPLPAGPFDCIFLKNVLIYFDTNSKRAVLRNLLRVLKPEGYLVIGPTEGVSGMLEGLERIKPWLYRKPAAEPAAGADQ